MELLFAPVLLAPPTFTATVPLQHRQLRRGQVAVHADALIGLPPVEVNAVSSSQRSAGPALC